MISKKELERQAFLLIQNAGIEGILQIEMWKILGVNSRYGSRIAFKLLKSGVIKRRKELNESRWTYRIFSIKKPVNVDSIIDCPCTACNDIDRCTTGNIISPLLCKKLTNWIDRELPPYK